MKKRVTFYLVVSLVLLASLAQSGPIIGEIFDYNVKINEFEQNPPGSDSGNEWLEIYNLGDPFNLSGWYIKNSNNDSFFFPSEIVSDFYVLNLSVLGFDNIDENISLYNQFDLMEDNTGLSFSDGSNDNLTWSRLPDGLGNFTFQQETRGLPNVPTLIQNKSSNSSCVLENDNILLSAVVTGFCIIEVNFGVLINGDWLNLSGNNISGNTYGVTLNSNMIFGNQNVTWTVSVLDCFNRTVQNGIENVYVNSVTNLSVFPPDPDGDNGWYISEPAFVLSNPDAQKIFYRWSDGVINYTGPFGLGDSANNGNVTGGIHTLTYFSGVCNESEQEFTGKFDFTNPIIKNLNPGNNSIVYNDPTPLLSAFLEELYAQNSGIDLTSVIFLVDGLFDGVPEVFESGDIDAIVEHVSSVLIDGDHNVTINVSDNAGRNSELTWFFETSSVVPLDMTVNYPVDGIIDNRKAMFNITLNREVEILEYVNYNDNIPKFKKLCSGCEEYGNSNKKVKTLKEGRNNLTIRATDNIGDVDVKNVSIFVDSKNPKITKFSPKSGFADGFFEVEFQELNPESLKLRYGNNTENDTYVFDIPTECIKLSLKSVCNTTLNLSDFNEQKIFYFFDLVDVAKNSILTKPVELDVDLNSPILTEIVQLELKGNKATFKLNISEKNFDEVTYFDNADPKAKEKKLCSKLNNGICKKSVSFKEGEHNVSLTISDEAGNFISVLVEFFIDSKDPKIKKSSPKSGFTNGIFEMEFEELNPVNVFLNYNNGSESRNAKVNLTDCMMDKKDRVCGISVDLSEFETQEIEYWFNITDLVGQHDESKTRKVSVDSIKPIVNSFDVDVDENKVEFVVNVSEKNFDGGKYIDVLDPNPKLKKLCSKLNDGICDRKVSLKSGNHSIDIFLFDEAGNFEIIEDILFEIF